MSKSKVELRLVSVYIWSISVISKEAPSSLQSVWVPPQGLVLLDSKGIFRRQMFLFKTFGRKGWWIHDSLCGPESENKPESPHFTRTCQIQMLGTVILMKWTAVFIRLDLIKWTPFIKKTLSSVTSSFWVSGSAVCVPEGMRSWFRSRTGIVTHVSSLVSLNTDLHSSRGATDVQTVTESSWMSSVSNMHYPRQHLIMFSRTWFFYLIMNN